MGATEVKPNLFLYYNSRWEPFPRSVRGLEHDLAVDDQRDRRVRRLDGPTIKVVRTLTSDPILISETDVAPCAGKAAKIANLFSGVRNYGLLGLVWFDAVAHKDWRIDNPAAIAAFSTGRSG